MYDELSTPINYLPGIGPSRAKLLEAELGIKTWRDLLYTFPYKHIDRSRLYKISELTTDMPFVQVKGQFLSFEEAGQGRKHRLTGHFWDGDMFLDVTWFHGIKYIKQSVKTRSTLGNIGTDNDGHYTLHFQLRNETQELNPELWVR